MATARVSRQCTKCKDNVGSFNCEGCKQLFCMKHSIEHRQELNARFEQLMTNLNVILQQTQDNEQQGESFKEGFSDRILEWENKMVERVHERAKQIRQELDEQINNRNKTIMNNIQSLTNDIRIRHGREDFLERDIEQIKENINGLQREINKSIQQSDINLRIESNDTIDWNHLIYFKEKSNTASSSVTSKEASGKKREVTRTSMNSTPIQNNSVNLPSYMNPMPYYIPPPPLNPPYVQIIRPANQEISNGNSIFSTYPLTPPSSSNQQNTQRDRKPLTIVDPGSQRPIGAPPSSSSDEPSANVREQTQTLFRQQFAALLTDSYKK